MSSTSEFIQKAREVGKTDQEITGMLINAGWKQEQITAALASGGELVPPPPPGAEPANSAANTNPQGTPFAVTAIDPKLTNHGLEYTIMFVSLWAFASSLGFLLHTAVSSTFSTSHYPPDVTFPIAALLVALPMYIGSFIYNKRLQDRQPEVTNDRARQSLTNMTLLVTFLMALGYLIYFLYSLLKGGSDGGDSLVESFLHMLITVSICTAIFIYYWRDSRHKSTA